jgi:hypothetical protein
VDTDWWTLGDSVTEYNPCRQGVLRTWDTRFD